MPKEDDMIKELRSEIESLKEQLDEARRDSKALKAALDAVSSIKNKMEYVLGVTKTGIDIIDENYNMEYIDPEWQKIYGDHRGRKCYEYFMGRTSPCPGCGVPKAIASGQPVVSEEMLSKEGNRPIRVTTIPIKGEDGKWRVAEVNIDISSRLKFEKALSESEEKFSNLANNAKDPIILLDGEGKVTFWNPAAAEVFGYTKEEMLGQDLHRLVTPNKYHEPYYLGFLKFKESGKGPVVGKTQELTALRKDGTEFPVELSVSAYRTGSGWNAAGILRDITQRKHAESELAAYRKHLEELVGERTGLLEQREAELKEKVADLERFNKLAVGRELKMIELKEKIRELEMRLALTTRK